MVPRDPTRPALIGAPTGNSECPVCAEARRMYLFVIRGLPVAQCPGCGLISLQPQPDLADIRACYVGLNDADDPRLFWTDGTTERDAVQHYLKALRERGVNSGRILLVAPPNHRFAADAAAKGFEIGRHVSVDEVDRGLALDGVPFDAAVVLYQFEKCIDPANFLQRIHSALSSDGVILIAVPTIDSWPAEFFGHGWTEWRPENRYYFSRPLLQSILLKSGFRQVATAPERRLYSLRHVADRARAFPRTSLTRLIRLLYRLVPAQLRDARVRLASSGVIVTAVRSVPLSVPRCSIVVAAYNERQTFSTLMDALIAKSLNGMEKEIIVVESNSQDGTREAAIQYQSHPEVKVILQDRPRGKGHAVREGLAHATGDIILIQDADLEYDLNDYDLLLEPLLQHRATFVLGARHGGSWKMRQFDEQQRLSTALNLGHVFFTTLLNILYGQHMRDPVTMFKVFRRDCLFGLEFERNRFDFDHELVIKLVRKGYRPLEIPVNYRARSFKEGKKVRLVRDPLTWLWVDFKFRFTPLFRAAKE